MSGCSTGCLCDQCAALCCRYIALPIDNPKSLEQYDNIRWYLLHENIVVFIEKKQWYIGIMSRCKHLQSDNRCGIYETRPRICRSYTTDNCDYHGGEYDFDVLFTSAEQLRLYAEEKLGRSIIPRTRKKPNGQPVHGQPVHAKVNGKPANAKPASRKPVNDRKPVNGTPSGTPNGNGSLNGKPKVRFGDNGKVVSLPLLRQV